MTAGGGRERLEEKSTEHIGSSGYGSDENDNDDLFPEQRLSSNGNNGAPLLAAAAAGGAGDNRRPNANGSSAAPGQPLYKRISVSTSFVTNDSPKAAIFRAKL